MAGVLRRDRPRDPGGTLRNTSASNYLGWLADLCAPYLGDKVLELGSGHGDLTERLAAGRTVHASDVSETAWRFSRSGSPGAANVTVQRIDIAEQSPDEKYDTIVMVNVLEHIEDDAKTVRRLGESLVPGGRLVLYVPAMQVLYSQFDRDIGHYRRYRRDDLAAILRDEGYRSWSARYVNSVGAFGWFVYCRMLSARLRTRSRWGPVTRWSFPCSGSSKIGAAPPFGLSVLCVGEWEGS